jgi:hypothetical protein
MRAKILKIQSLQANESKADLILLLIGEEFINADNLKIFQI